MFILLIHIQQCTRFIRYFPKLTNNDIIWQVYKTSSLERDLKDERLTHSKFKSRYLIPS